MTVSVCVCVSVHTSASMSLIYTYSSQSLVWLVLVGHAYAGGSFTNNSPHFGGSDIAGPSMVQFSLIPPCYSHGIQSLSHICTHTAAVVRLTLSVNHAAWKMSSGLLTWRKNFRSKSERPVLPHSLSQKVKSMHRSMMSQSRLSIVVFHKICLKMPWNLPVAVWLGVVRRGF